MKTYKQHILHQVFDRSEVQYKTYSSSYGVQFQVEKYNLRVGFKGVQIEAQPQVLDMRYQYKSHIEAAENIGNWVQLQFTIDGVYAKSARETPESIPQVMSVVVFLCYQYIKKYNNKFDVIMFYSNKRKMRLFEKILKRIRLPSGFMYSQFSQCFFIHKKKDLKVLSRIDHTSVLPIVPMKERK